MKSGETNGTYNLHGVMDSVPGVAFHEFAFDYVMTIQMLFWDHAHFLSGRASHESRFATNNKFIVPAANVEFINSLRFMKPPNFHVHILVECSK